MNILAKNQNGFTLVELLIALVIFAVGILGIATMQITSITGNSKGRHISEASNVGSDQIEKIIALNYDDITLTDGAGNHGVAGLDDSSSTDGFLDSDNDGTADDGDGDGVADVSWNVAEDYPILNTKTIRVIVDPIDNGSNVSMDIVKMGPIN